MARRSYSGVAAATRLTTNLTAVDTVFSVESGAGYPPGSAGSFFVLVDRDLPTEEKVLVASRSGNVFTIAASGRGQDGTPLSTHAPLATVEHTVTATDLDEANAHVNATTGVHGTTGALVDTATAQTLTNKTLGTGTVFPATVVDTNTSQTLTNKTLGTGTVFPATVVDTTSTQTLTNKTLGTGSVFPATVVDTTSTQTLTNKTLGTGSVFPATVVDTTSTQTLTNKTLSAPIVTAHLRTTGSAPSPATAGAGAGTGATVTVAGNDTAGIITITTGTTPAAGLLATLTWASSYPAAPRIVVTPTNAAAAGLPVFTGSSTSTGTFSAATAATASTAFTYAYLVVE